LYSVVVVSGIEAVKADTWLVKAQVKPAAVSALL
jgi:hypothetical protein